MCNAEQADSAVTHDFKLSHVVPYEHVAAYKINKHILERQIIQSQFRKHFNFATKSNSVL